MFQYFSFTRLTPTETQFFVVEILGIKISPLSTEIFYWETNKNSMNKGLI